MKPVAPVTRTFTRRSLPLHLPLPRGSIHGEDLGDPAVAAEPVDLPEAALIDEADAERSLAEYRGRYVLLNFWATWCAPCREEMPSLDRLQADLGSDRFAVVSVAVGRNPVPAINRFFAEQGIANLPKLRDPKQQLAGAMGARGLPVTVLVDPEGREIARLTGPAEWDSPEAKALITAMAAEGG